MALLPAHAQSGLTGTWQAEVDSGGRLHLWTIDLVQLGSEIDGTVDQGIGDVVAIHSGKASDRSVQFEVQIPGDRVITFTGDVSGEQIAFTRDVVVSDDGDPGGFGIYGQRAVSEFTARRVPPGGSRKEPRGGPLARRLTIYDREGQLTRKIGEPGDYRWPALSPDGTQLAVVRPDRTKPLVGSPADPDRLSPIGDAWIFDLSSGDSSIVASAPQLRTPIWFPDGSRIAYFSYRDGHGQVHWRSSDGSGVEMPLLRLPLGVGEVLLDDFSSDARLLSFSIGSTLQVLSLADPRQAVELLREEYSAYGAAFSFDDRFLAYLSNERDDTGVYVRAFDSRSIGFSGAPLAVGQVARDWARPRYVNRRVHWRRDAAELYYQNESGQIMAVAVTDATALRAGSPRLLFEAPSTGMHEWNDLFMTVGEDGEQFVFAVPEFPPSMAIAPERLARYAGTYRFESDATEVVVVFENDQLWSKRSDDPQVVGPMIPVSELSFYSQRLGEEIDFSMNDAGDVTHLISYTNGVGTKAVRREAWPGLQ